MFRGLVLSAGCATILINMDISDNGKGPVLQVSGLNQSFRSGGKPLQILFDVNFSVQAGETVAIVGPSGSGKTTLLGLCAGLDVPTSGTVRLGGVSIEELSEDERAALRNNQVGFVFQNFQLIPTLTALENVSVPMELRGEKKVGSRARDLLERVGLGHRLEHYPIQLSGGEQQRVAMARAFSNQPSILFADEPTGNLDSDTSHNVTDLLFEINRDHGTTLILVTHNLELAGMCQRVLKIADGRLSETHEHVPA